MALVKGRWRPWLLALVAIGGCKADSLLFESDPVAEYDPPIEITVPAIDAEEVTFPSGAETLHAFYFHHADDIGYDRTILLSHGRDGNLARTPEWVRATTLYYGGFDVLAYDYRGYGRSTGQSVSEATMDSDATAALDYLRQTLGVTPDHLVLYGHSIGAVPTLTLAQQLNGVAAVAIESAFTSAQAMSQTATLVDAPVGWFLRGSFDDVDRIAEAAAPVAIFHGALDVQVPVSQAYTLYARARAPKFMHVFNNAGHDDIENQPEFGAALDTLARMAHASLPASIRARP